MRRILRWVIPVDNEWHRVDAAIGSIVKVATRARPYAEVWALDDSDLPGKTWLRCYATGDQVEGSYVGTSVTPDGELVWHVFAREA